MARTVNWQRVAEATLHPLQVEILKAAASCDRISPVQFNDAGAPLPRVGYHFRALHKVGLLEEAGTASKRGATEHFYRLSRKARRR